MHSDSNSDDSDSDVSFDSTDDEAIIYRMELVERRRRRKKKRKSTRENMKKIVNQSHCPLPIPSDGHDDDNNNNNRIIEQNNKISTITAILPSYLASQQQLFRSSTTSTCSTTTTTTISGNKSDTSPSPSKRKRKRKPYTSWKEMYQRLLAYKKEHDDSTKVPQNYKKDQKLGHWVGTQRKFHNKHKLLPARYSLLASIDFDWGTGPQGPHMDWWMEMHQRLVEYKKQHDGSTKVPINYEKDAKLGPWVAVQRQANYNNTLLPDRYSLLDSIDFDWGDGKRIYTDWMETYQQLVVYKQQYNTTNVPANYKEDPKLCTWVYRQRYAYKNKNMPEERISCLNSIGFDWRDKNRRRINTGKPTDEVPVPVPVPVPPPSFTNSVVHIYQSCAPNDTTNATGSSSSSSRSNSSRRHSSLTSQQRPIINDSNDDNDDDDDEDVIII